MDFFFFFLIRLYDILVAQWIFFIRLYDIHVLVEQ